MGKKRTYSTELKDSVVKRLEPPTNDTLTSLSNELGIPRTTIYQWKKNKNKKTNNNKPTSKWNSKDKFQAVLEISTLTEIEVAQYCRRKGIHVDEIKTWQKQCLKANTSILEDPQELKNNLKKERDRIKKLQRELRRKEKALAETAALLVLRKKANAIWGDPEDE